MSISEAIIDTYGHKEGLCTLNGEITRWPYSEPQPGPQELESILSAYEAKKASEARTSGIKAIAYSKIINILPEWKQRNLIARSVELVELGESRTQEEESEHAAIKALWARVKAIRAHSDVLEANPELDINAGWPE